MIEIEGLRKRYALSWVLRDISLTVAAGQFVSILGPNGAGKSTLLRILATLSSFDGGGVTIGGYDARAEAPMVRRLIGYVAHQPMLYAELSAAENLTFFGRLYGVAQLPERVRELLVRVDLERRRDDRVRTFSRGMNQRLAIARAMLANPPVLLLDEPDDGLDPEAVDQLPGYLAGDRTVMMVSHNLARSLRSAQRIIILVRGRIAFDAPAKDLTLGELEAQYRQHTGSTRRRNEDAAAA